MKDIEFYNRYTGKMETEQVYGEAFLKWAYGNPLGKAALHTLVKRPFFSRWYGGRMDLANSAQRIDSFIHDYDLDVSEFADEPKNYQSFNEFFYRKLKPSARPIANSSVVFPADGRHLGFANTNDIQGVFIKGQQFDVLKLLGDEKLADRYLGGSLVLSRLCPVDYHRYHFPVSGTASETQMINGPLFSVSPIALRKQLSYLWQNKRTITSIKTETMGTVIMMEIGATCVGSIQQTFTPKQPVQKGEEKGYFAFGGSSTLTLFEPDTIKIADDLLENSSKQIETYARMGDHLAEAKN
ncbi:phosphatidylserine decarboxylase [Verrucomicrobiaceae bacterium N1E253]|uniref:phosphatidylserine decarboxylase n=1 Tax=Oceaniferula marina TaxID=2748318 RepID=A0A851GGR0_9BACT|nr:archaetidylserine decarboxylase [Oceaniferula marina]NWK54435.1 phosphatidylserine decarboxylase [Oceaniferula marina]